MEVQFLRYTLRIDRLYFQKFRSIHFEWRNEAQAQGQSQILCKQRRVVENRANIFSAAAAQAVAALSTT